MSDWRQRIGEALSQWVRLCLLLLLCMVAVRPLFFLELLVRLGLAPAKCLTVLSGSLFDLLLVCRIMAFGLIPFVLLHVFAPKVANYVSTGMIVLYAVVFALLTEYYCNLSMPLDHVILVYTPEELKTTVFSSTTSLTLGQVLWFVLLVGLPVLLLWLCRHFRCRHSVVFIMVALLATVFVPYREMIRKERLYGSHDDFCLAVNQPSYSWVKLSDYRREMRRNAEGDCYPYDAEAVRRYQALHPEFEYDHPGYPFYRKATDPDVLGSLLNPTSDQLPPNLVFIVVEGLGRRLTGVTNPSLSFTPFLDSLASEGLFWPNCFSTSERTFGALPALFASAPHGRHGFTWQLPMPRHHSLLLDLKRNGYTTSFYYGGDESFDHYYAFMRDSRVDYLFEAEMEVGDSTQYKLLMDNNRWGLDDRQLFEAAIDHRKAVGEKRPYADVYLTLTTHEPFVVDGLEVYEQQVRDMLEQTPGVIEKERENVMKNLNVYACFLYLDQSVRRLFEDYASRPDFANTVFVITGDHRMAPVLPGIGLRYYNVPMIVYSPLVGQPKTMQAIVSHLDVTPSFNAYLHGNYEYDIDDHCHWLGTSFDTVVDYRNTRKLSFMRNNRDVMDYLSDGYYLSHHTLIRLDSLFVGYSLDYKPYYERYKAELDDFETVSRFVVQHDLLMP